MEHWNVKSCPVCGAAMLRVASDESLIIHRCDDCLAEVVKPTPRTRERRRIWPPERRTGGPRERGTLRCRIVGFEPARASDALGRGWP